MSHWSAFCTISFSINAVDDTQHDRVDALVSLVSKWNVYMIPRQIFFQAVLNLMGAVDGLSEVKVYKNTPTQVIASARAHLGTLSENSSGKEAARQAAPL
jgi:hypothetical protein